METIKTTLYGYRYDITNPEQKAAYEALCAKLKAQGLKCFETHGGGSHYIGTADPRGLAVELETACVFDNQWNTASTGELPDRRVFDWAQDYPSHLSGCSSNTRRGHYIVQTKEMKTLRDETLKCGYCGKHYGPAHTPAPADGYCDACLDSEYLEVCNLPLLRLVPVSKERKPGAKESGHIGTLMARYKQAQLHGSTERGKARIKAKREKLHADYKKTVDNATTERDGFLWLMDKGINTDNCIFYSHTGKFSFGWRKPVSAEIESELLDIISEFPFAYEIKTESGKVLSAE